MLGLALLAESLPKTWTPILGRNVDGFDHVGEDPRPWTFDVSRDERLLLIGTSTGGLVRSLDRGKSWEPSNVGLSTHRIVDLAIDPHFPNRVLLVGTNDVVFAQGGIALSTDGARSWRMRLALELETTIPLRGRIAFDPTTRGRDRTRVAYWSRWSERPGGFDPRVRTAKLYKTTDGGESWRELASAEPYAGGELRVDPRNGWLSTRTERALMESRDGGATWRAIDSPPMIATSSRAIEIGPDGTIAYANGDSIALRPPGEREFRELTRLSDLKTIATIRISPLEPRHLAVSGLSPEGAAVTCVSRDRGRTWNRAEGGAALPFWSHRDRARIWTTDDDRALVSNDAGRRFHRISAKTPLYVDGPFHFNPLVPDTIVMGNVGGNAGVSRDGGRSWTSLATRDRGLGRVASGAYPIANDAFVLSVAPERWEGGALYIQRRNSTVWERQARRGGLSILSDPRHPGTVFSGELRLTGQGDGANDRDWGLMTRCDRVCTAAAGKLYGIKWNNGVEASLVMSSDSGVTWPTIARVPSGASDVAVTPDGATIYVAAGELIRLENGRRAVLALSKRGSDESDEGSVRSVAIDPVDPRVIYVARGFHDYNSKSAAMRSRDAGRTWETLNRNAPLRQGRLDGGRAATWVRVHPKTREPWFATGNYGLWKLIR